MSLKKHRAIVFCDFDGTITACETFVGVLKQFSPVLANEIIPKILSKDIPLREGVRKIIESIPSSTYPDEFIEFVRDKPIRSGLSSLLDYLADHTIPFIVVSGGIRCLVEFVLQREDLLHRCAKIYAIDIDRTNQHLQVQSDWEFDSELVAKVKVIEHERQNEEKIIVIGDSITDLNAAKRADIVFARDKLCTYLNEEKIPFYSWTDFQDIRQQLEQMENDFLF